MTINTKKVIAGILSVSMLVSYVGLNLINISNNQVNLLEIDATGASNISESGIQFIKNREGYQQYAYSDYSQYSIGYGCRCEKGQYPNGITESEADTLLKNTLKSYVNAISSWANSNGVNLTQYQFDALVSFSFNVGVTAFKDSTLAKRIIAHESAESITDAFAMWNKVTVNGVKTVSNGLVDRRKYESNLYNYSDYAGSEVASDNIDTTLASKLSEVKSSAENFELILQRNYSNVEYWGGDDNKYQVSDDGCALIAVLNLVKWNTGNTPNINQLIDVAHNNGDRKWNQSGTASSFFKHYSDEHGSQYGLNHITTFSTSNTSDITNYLSQGYDLVIHVSGHYIAAVDYDSVNNKILILDGAPSSKRYTQSAKAVWLPVSYFNGSISKLSFTEITAMSFNESVTTKLNISGLLNGANDGIKNIWNQIINGTTDSVTSTYNYPEPTRQLYLKSPMMNGNDVKWVQSALVQAGYSLTIDGYFGNKTKEAVVSYQSKHGLTADGIVGPSTRSSLKSTLSSNTTQTTVTASEVAQYSEPSRNIGYTSPITTGSDVKWVQSTLNYLNGAGLSIDGQYGPLTRTAVRAFQASHGLSVDGIVGPKTLSEMKACLNNEQGTYTPNTTSMDSILNNGYPAPTRQLYNGTSGDDVKWLQLVLNRTINAGLVIDGSFGSKTKSAVKSFQSTYGLDADGIVGSNTLAKLKEIGSNIFVGAIAEPTMATIELSNSNKTYYANSESIDFIFDTDSADTFEIVINDEDNNEVLRDTTQDYKYSAYLEDTGVYTAYVIGSNENGSYTSKSINFEIIAQNSVETGAYIIKFDMFGSKLTYDVSSNNVAINNGEDNLGDIWTVNQDDDWTLTIINAETNKYLTNDNGTLILKTYEELGGIDIDAIPDSAKWYMFVENGHCFIKNKLSNETLTTNMNDNIVLDQLDITSFSQEIALETVSEDTIVPTCQYLENGDVQIIWNDLATADSYSIFVYDDSSVESYLDLIVDTNSIVFTPPEGNFSYTIEANNNGTFFVGSGFDSEDTMLDGTGKIDNIIDENEDHSQNIVDLINLKKYLLGLGEYSSMEIDLMDVNLDGKVDILDVITLKNWILN